MEMKAPHGGKAGVLGTLGLILQLHLDLWGNLAQNFVV